VDVGVGGRQAFEVVGVTRQQGASARLDGRGHDVGIDHVLAARTSRRQHATDEPSQRPIGVTDCDGGLAREERVDD
jgi:hypothetical protein